MNLTNCTFHVQEAGRERVRKEGRKNVHAWVRGDLIMPPIPVPTDLDETIVKYNPYEFDYFVDTDGYIVESAYICVLRSDGLVHSFNVVYFDENAA